MRVLTDFSSRATAGRGQDAVWVLTIHWPDGVAHYAHRRVVLSDATVSATLVAPGKLQPSTPRPSVPAVRLGEQRLTVSLRLDDGAALPLRDHIRRFDPEGLLVDWGLVLLDETGTGRLADRIPFFWGIVDSVGVSRAALDLRCLDILSARALRRLGHPLTSEEVPEKRTPAVGRMIPWVFGAPGEMELFPWREGLALQLTRALTADDAVVPLIAVDAVTDSGVVQVGAELIAFASVDRANKSLTGLTRTTPASHPAGARTRLVPEQGFEWLVAEHPCLAVHAVLAEGEPLPSSAYTVSQENWNGRVLQKVTMTKWPGETGSAARISAVVEGMFEGDALLENPADILWFLLTDARGAGMDSSRLDAASFAESRSALDAMGYRFSNAWGTPVTLRGALEQILFEARCRLSDTGDKIALVVDRGDADLSSPGFPLDASVLLRGGSLALKRGADRTILRGITLHYGCDFSGASSDHNFRRFFYSDAVAAPEDNGGAGAEASVQLYWHNHGVPEVVSDLARLLIARHGCRSETVVVHAPFCAAPLTPGDRVQILEARFPLALDAGRIEAVAVPEPHLLQLHAVFPLAGTVCWRWDAATFLRHRAGESRVEFWIENRMVCCLDWTGALRLRGQLIEDVPLPSEAAAPVSFDPAAQHLLFSAGAPGAYAPCFALDSDGNLLLAGEASEDTPRRDLTLAECIEATPQWFAKCVSETSPALVFDVASRRLQIRGVLVEQSNLY